MALTVQRPLGTADVTPSEIHKWYTVEQTAQRTAQVFGFREIRFPTFENTDLFLRSVGETTDVVQKEMYSVIAKESKFTLRPEGTAGTIRAVMQNGMLNDALPQKVFYITSCFRHEKPQAGRLREFHQFGAEMIGSKSPSADAEMISMAHTLLNELGLKNIELNINSIGCPKCRAEYHKAQRAFFEDRKSELCGTCLGRLEKNPMRILDCKSPICSGIAKDAPVITDFLCEECSDHFTQLKELLDLMKISYKVNPKIVRGLDYYTKTVFEFITTDIGAQGTVLAGGRYDGLVSQLGGADTPALGFAAGLERLVMTMEKQGCSFMEPDKCDLYIVPMGDAAMKKSAELAALARAEGYITEYDLMNRSLKAQMKYANKIGAAFVVVIGDNELEAGTAKLKNMETGDEKDIVLDSSFGEKFSEEAISAMFETEEANSMFNI